MFYLILILQLKLVFATQSVAPPPLTSSRSSRCIPYKEGFASRVKKELSKSKKKKLEERIYAARTEHDFMALLPDLNNNQFYITIFLQTLKNAKSGETKRAVASSKEFSQLMLRIQDPTLIINARGVVEILKTLMYLRSKYIPQRYNKIMRSVFDNLMNRGIALADTMDSKTLTIAMNTLNSIIPKLKDQRLCKQFFQVLMRRFPTVIADINEAGVSNALFVLVSMAKFFKINELSPSIVLLIKKMQKSPAIIDEMSIDNLAYALSALGKISKLEIDADVKEIVRKMIANYTLKIDEVSGEAIIPSRKIKIYTMALNGLMYFEETSLAQSILNKLALEQEFYDSTPVLLETLNYIKYNRRDLTIPN